MDKLLDSPPILERVPNDGTYHEPNARGEIPFTPNDNYGRELGQGQRHPKPHRVSKITPLLAHIMKDVESLIEKLMSPSVQ